MKKIQVMEMLYAVLLERADCPQAAGFAPEYTLCSKKNGAPVYERSDAAVMDFSGEKGVVRLVFSDDKIHLLTAGKEAGREDDSAFDMQSTYLFLLNEYGEKDVKSLAAEICEYISDTFVVKKNSLKSKSPSTVSRAAAKSGLLSYDSVTLASKLAGMFPELKDKIAKNIEVYGEFLCEDFFVNYANAYIMNTLKENNPQKMKRLFNILGEVYEDGTNEVQSLIAVTVLGPVQDDPEIMQRIMPYLTDTMLEPVIAVNERLKKSKTARMRLENPPKYKPPKKKKSSFMSRMMENSIQQQ